MYQRTAADAQAECRPIKLRRASVRLSPRRFAALAPRSLTMTDLSLRVFDSVLDMLSNENNPTPIVRLNRIIPFEHTQVYAKLEWYNPFGAVKDRIAANLVRDA